jgi:site-specific DNA-methyltransferase (cytosine-N4-specific)
MKANRIYHTNAFDAVVELGDATVDLVLTSPPYADQRRKTYEGKPADEYVGWFLPLSAQLYRVLKLDGSFILNIKENVIDGQRSTYVMHLVMALQEQGWFWTETYIWHKKNAMPGKWPNRLRDAWEYCFHFTKQRKFKMYQEAVKIPMGDWADKRMKALSANDRKRSNSATDSGFGRLLSNWSGKDMVYPDNVIMAEDVSSKHTVRTIIAEGIRRGWSEDEIAELILRQIQEPTNVLHEALVGHNKMHSAVFPEKLPEFFIKLFTAPGDLVLDPFLGSGTTAKVAKDLNRTYLGFELKKEYYDIAKARLGLSDGGDLIVFTDPDLVTSIDSCLPAT